MGGILYLLAYQTPFFPIIRWFTLLFFAVVGLVIYIAVLFILKEFKKRDLLFFIAILNPKKLLSYITSELKSNKPKN